ncbi:hypothetical protein RND81_10G050100 [Saponaria officinalis]|uniref:LOB domain-containing protein n=1 Tax=Saponaria officinalis TaxID=3572 RepID=A0AAW1I0J9_SAPOF
MPDHYAENNRRKGAGKKSGGGEVEGAAPSAAPCGACKFLRRKCTSGCIFAPHFGMDQGAARFAAVHKVFGASNVSKLLLHIPMNRRHDAVLTISYEAQARLSDPVYGCVSTILALQHQVATLQAELATVQNQVVNSRLAVANALQSSTNGFEVMQLPHQQPAFSSNSSASNNFLNMSTTFNVVASTTYDFTPVVDNSTAPSSHSFELLQLSRPSQNEGDEDEEISRNRFAFADQIMHSR